MRAHPIGLSALLAALVALPCGLGAQEAPLAPIGSTVRIVSPAYSGVATVIGSRQDSLHVVVEGLSAPVALPRETITRLERRRPATALERISRGAAWGAGTMGAVGLLLVAVEPPPDTGDDAEQITAAEFVMFGATGGALWGAVIGLAIPQHRWVPVSSARIGYRAAPGGGLAASASVAF